MNLRLARLDVTEASMGEAVLGAPVAVRISGRVSGEGGVIEAALDVERTDGVAGVAALAATFDPLAATLRLEAQAAEPAGGVVTRALGLAPYPPLAISVEGSGRLDDWRGTVTAAAEGLLRVEASLGFPSQRLGTVQVAGRADVGELVDRDWRSLMTDGVAFAFECGLDDDSTIVVEGLSVSAEAWSMSGGARLTLDTLDLDMSLRLKLANARPISELIGPVGFEGVEADLAVRGRLYGSPLGVTGAGTARGLRFDDPLLTALAGGTVAWTTSSALDLDAMVLSAREFAAENGVIRASAAGSFGFDSGAVDASVEAVIGDLAALAPAVGATVGGQARLEGFVSGTAGGDLVGTVAGTLRDLSTGIAGIDALLARDSGFGADVSVAADGTLRLGDITFDSGALRGEGSVTLPPDLDTVSATLRLRLGDLALLSSAVGMALDGAAIADVEIGGALGAPSVAGSGRADRIAVEGVDLGAVSAGFALRPDFEHVELTQVAATVEGVPLRGALNVDLATGLVEGGLVAELPPGGATIAGWRFGGTLAADIHLTRRGTVQSVDVSVKGGPLTAHPADGPVIGAASVAFDASIADPGGGGEISARLDMGSVDAGGVSVSTVTASADGSLADTRVSVGAQGIAGDAAMVQAQGKFAFADAGARAVIRQMTGRVEGYRLRLGTPLAIAVDGDIVTVAPLAIEIGDGRIAGGGRVGPDSVTADFAVDAVPLDLARLVVGGERIGGVLDGRASMTTEGGRVVGTAEATVRGTTYKADADTVLPPLDGAASVRLGAQGAEIDARVIGLMDHDITAAGRIPLTIDVRTLSPTLDRAAPIAGRLDWNGDIGPLWELLPLDQHRLTGNGTVALSASGSLDASRFGGTVSIREGTFEHLVAGMLIDDLVLDVAPRPDGQIAVRLSGTDGNAGRISGSGILPLEIEGHSPLAFEVSLTDMTVVRRDDVTAVAGGRVRYEGSLAEGRVTGDIVTTGIEARLVDRLPPSVVALDVVEVDGPGDGTAKPTPEEDAPEWSGTLDVSVEMPQRVFVRGRGLESEWAGTLRVTGPAEAPRIEGALGLVRGFFTFADKRFTLTKGTVVFDGKEEIDPALDIVAERETSGVVAVISIGGRASAPSIGISSRPALPRDEVVARVLFGKGVAEITAVEAVQLAAALDALRGEGDITGDIFDFARNTLGVDVLTVDPGTGEDGSPSVGVGRYVGDRTFIGVKQGADLQSGSAAVEVEVTPNISVESEVGQDASGSLGLQWKWNY